MLKNRSPNKLLIIVFLDVDFEVDTSVEVRILNLM